jgi:hypothetical protein
MKRLAGVFVGVMLFAGCAAVAGEMEATTGDGKKVILHPDGTWVFKQTVQSRESGSAFTRPPRSTKVLNSRKGFYELWIDPTKWGTEVSHENPDAEFNLAHTSGDAYAMVIPERIEMPIASLKRLALENAREVAPDAKIVFDKERVVNGVKVVNMRIDGTIEGIKFTYYGYYWVGRAGTLQFIAYTGQNLFEEFEPEFTDLLNGLVITKP